MDKRVCINVHSRTHRLSDPDGRSIKAAIDGLVLGRLLPDDSAKYVKAVTQSQEKIASDKEEKTLIVISDGKV